MEILILYFIETRPNIKINKLSVIYSFVYMLYPFDSEESELIMKASLFFESKTISPYMH